MPRPTHNTNNLLNLINQMLNKNYGRRNGRKRNYNNNNNRNATSYQHRRSNQNQNYRRKRNYKKKFNGTNNFINNSNKPIGYNRIKLNYKTYPDWKKIYESKLEEMEEKSRNVIKEEVAKQMKEKKIEELSWKAYRSLVYDINKLKLTNISEKANEDKIQGDNKEANEENCQEQMYIETEGTAELWKQYWSFMKRKDEIEANLKKLSHDLEKEMIEEQERERSDYEKKSIRRVHSNASEGSNNIRKDYY